MSQHAFPLEVLHELVDGRLDPLRRDEVEEHVRGCEQCRRQIEALSAVKRSIARLGEVETPPGFEARLVSALDAAPGPQGQIDAPARIGGLRWLVPVGIAAAVVLAGFLWWRPAPSLPEAAAVTLSDYDTGRLVLASSERDAARLTSYLGERVPFTVRVFDLGMMGYTIEGGQLHDVGGHASALWVYRGPAGIIICQMYRGLTTELPEPAEAREANGFTFLVYHEAGGTQVFWQEGDVVCVLASSLPSEEVVQLAIAKAMKP
jgi:anti-sigma factor RsiW